MCMLAARQASAPESPAQWLAAYAKTAFVAPSSTHRTLNAQPTPIRYHSKSNMSAPKWRIVVACDGEHKASLPLSHS